MGNISKELKITKASKKDKFKSTLNLAQLDEFFDMPARNQLGYGDSICLDLEGVPTVFIVNRVDKNGYATTAYTEALPRKFRMPSVGKPTYVTLEDFLNV